MENMVIDCFVSKNLLH